ncbi:MAG TPA: hypothetical protein VJ144_11135 [Candidatus Polarisedimenticolia bacterium]|nr:hypothetical protein [Candidatus Polarisedimenticolia bacterium]
MEAGFAAMLLDPPRPGALGPFLASYAAAFVPYGLAARAALCTRAAGLQSRASLGVVLAFACLFRATLILAPPALSDDIYRYRFDGRVVLSGGNPYLDPPGAAGVALPRDALDSRVAHQDVRTIYPPLAELVFAAGAAIAPGLLGLKALLVLCDLLGILLLRWILKRRGLPEVRVLVYAWNPLAIIEVAWSGHLEPAGVLLVLCAAAAIIQRRDLGSTLALTLAALVKIFPLALFAPFLRSTRARALLLPPIVAAAFYWPYRDAGPRLFEGAWTYARRWSANDSLFGIVQAAIVWIDPTPLLKEAIAWTRARIPGSGPLDRLYGFLYPPDLARAFCALAAVAAAFFILRRERDPLRGAFLLTGALLLLSPTLHPWYLLWILPWLALFPSRAWILLTGLVALAYLNLGAAGRAAEPHPWVHLPEYLPFYLLLAREWTARRRRSFDRRSADPRGGPVARAGSGW